MVWKELAPAGYALLTSLLIHAGMLQALAALGALPSGARLSSPAPAIVLQAKLHEEGKSVQGETVPMAAKATATLAAAALRGAIPLPLLQYLPPSELDAKPEVIGAVPLVYPPQLPFIRHGSVLLTLLIDEEGEVDKVLVEAFDTPEELADLARRAFASARFRPGQRGDQAVKSRLRVEVTFDGS